MFISRLVDFQLSSVTSPAVDLMYFMNSSTAPEVLENHHVLVDEYYSTLCQTLTTLGHQDLQPTRATLDAELKKKRQFGLVAGLTVRAFALADRNHLPDIDNMISDRNNYSAKFSESFKSAVEKILPMYEKWGWLKM